MSVLMRVNKLGGRPATKEIDGEKIIFWGNYNGTFSKKPTASELGAKKSKFRRFVQRELLKLTDGKLFKLLPLIWTKISGSPLKFHVLVRIQERSTPPTNPTPTPTPVPKSPGQI